MDIPCLKVPSLLFYGEIQLFLLNHTEYMADIQRHQPPGHLASGNENQPYIFLLHQTIQHGIQLLLSLWIIQPVKVIYYNNMLFIILLIHQLLRTDRAPAVILISSSSQKIPYQRRLPRPRNAIDINCLIASLSRLKLFRGFFRA